MVWGIIGSVVLLVLLVSPLISGLAHNRYASWSSDRVIGLFVNIGDWELKQLGMKMCSLAVEQMTTNNLVSSVGGY